MRTLGGPLPFPSDAGRQLSCPILPSKSRLPNRSGFRVDHAAPCRESSDGADYDFCNIGRVRDTSPPRRQQLSGGNYGAPYPREDSILGCAQRSLRSRGRTSAGRLSNATRIQINPGQSARTGQPAQEGFQNMTAPIASGWSGCRAGLAPTGKRRLVTAHANSGRSNGGAANGSSPPIVLPAFDPVARHPTARTGVRRRGLPVRVRTARVRSASRPDRPPRAAQVHPAARSGHGDCVAG
jgi:hypothetical protein